MKNLLKCILPFFLLLFLVACNNEDNTLSSVQSQASDILKLTVSANDFVSDGTNSTRAVDNGAVTTFENGDRVGIIILDDNNKLLYNNVPYKYNGSEWSFDSGNVEGKGSCYYHPKASTYIVYYPYNELANGCKSFDDLKEQFKPQTNQSTKADYRASDLMVWQYNGIPSKKLTAKLNHAYASVSLVPTARYVLDDGNDTPYKFLAMDISDVSMTISDDVFVPYKAGDGSLRCILPTSFTNGDIRCFYTLDSDKTYSNTIRISRVSPNTRYTSAPELKTVTYNLSDAKLGDFYCNRGGGKAYLIPGDIASLSTPQKNACLGIVLKAGKDSRGTWKDDCNYKFKGTESEMSTIHGYVLALYDARSSKGCSWGSLHTAVYTNTERNTGFYGYKNTQDIISLNEKNGGTLSDAFPATYYATTDYEKCYPAPSNSSGWFLPSGGQCQYWINNEKKLLEQVRKIRGNASWQNYYWSSSEEFYNWTLMAWYLDFLKKSIEFEFNQGFKTIEHSVRSCLAF